jgi:hypothetical protein
MPRKPTIMFREGTWATAAVLAVAAGTLTACIGDRPPLGSGPEPASAARAAAPRAAPLAEMAGRWVLGSPGAGQCSMTFTGAPGAVEGTIAPEGGCPGKFFTSRRWVFDQDALVIRNHTGEPLARLAVSSPGHFDGQAASGETVSLAR